MSEVTQPPSIKAEQTGVVLPAPAGTRVDQAHVLGSAAPRDAVGDVQRAAVLAGESVELAEAAEVLPRMRVQGRQLARLLADRQAELDRREAQQNACLADLENEMRSARLWLAARHEDLAERAAGLDERERQLTDLASRLSAAEAYQDVARQESATDLERREESLARAQADLERQRLRQAHQAEAQRIAQESLEENRGRAHEALVHDRQQLLHQRHAAKETIRAALAGLEQRRLTIENDATALEMRQAEFAQLAAHPTLAQERIAADLEAQRDRLAMREKRLTEIEETQLTAAAELDTLRSELLARREQLVEQSRRAELDQGELAKAAAEELARERATLSRRHAELDHRAAQVEQLRSEVRELYRQAVEAQVIAQETLVRLAGSTLPAELQAALASARQSLSEQHRLSAEHLSQHRADLAQLNRELASRAERLTAQHQDVSTWAKRRQLENDRQATALDERERQIERLGQQLRDERDAWDRARLAHIGHLRDSIARRRQQAE